MACGASSRVARFSTTEFCWHTTGKKTVDISFMLIIIINANKIGSVSWSNVAQQRACLRANAVRAVVGAR
jgi:hypothetical protein